MGRGSLGFGIVRSIDPVRGRARLAELCEVMSQDLGTIVVPHHPATYDELTRSCERGDFALAWVPPVLAAKLSDAGRAKILALPVRRGSVSYHAALIARVGGPLAVSEIAGTRVAWVDRESCSGYIVPRLFLQAAQLDVDRLFSSERFVATHAAVVDAVSSSRVDVGATYCSPPAPRAASGAPGPLLGPWTGDASNHLTVLATTGPIPNDVIVTAADLPTDVRARVLRWLMALPARAQVASKELFGADSFRVASEAHFEPLRRLLAAARVQKRGAD